MDLMSIGEFAREAGLSPKALRIYDDLHLLRPAQVDHGSGYRSYAPDQLDAARLIAVLRRIGMPLARIRVALEAGPDAAADEVTAFWRQTEADVRSRRAQVSALIADLRSKESPMRSTRTIRTRVAHSLAQGRRQEQLDSVHVGTARWAVADGFGGMPSASARFVEMLAAEPEPIGDEQWDALAAACAAGVDGGGSTFTAVALRADVATVAHLGDSRGWLLRDGDLRRLTSDHTEVAGLVEDGRLTEEEARLHPQRATLNRALAAGLPSEPDVTGVTVQAGDRLVLTTDGVHAVLPDDVLAALLSAPAAASAVERVADAVRAAGEPDNHAIVAVDILP